MHRTSLSKMEAFWETYMLPECERSPIRVLEIGSKCYDDHPSYRQVMDHENVSYCGLDLEAGRNVDLVPGHPFVWKELGSNQFDFCISGQTFEHNPMFWVTFAEIARVLRPGGIALVIAPGSGAVHRYPLDCWRFYPDAWSSLCHYCGIELVETYFENHGNRRSEPSLMWCDSCVIARKPTFEDASQQAALDHRLNAISATATLDVPSADYSGDGPCFVSYESTAPYHRKRKGLTAAVSRLAKQLKRYTRGVRKSAPNRAA